MANRRSKLSFLKVMLLGCDLTILVDGFSQLLKGIDEDIGLCLLFYYLYIILYESCENYEKNFSSLKKHKITKQNTKMLG